VKLVQPEVVLLVRATEEKCQYGEGKASEAVEGWRETLDKVSLVVVSNAQSYLLILIEWMTWATCSSPERYKNLIQKLIDVTDKETLRRVVYRSGETGAGGVRC
jgi:hypothetical protein